MAGLGLMSALDAMQEGVSWKQGQDQIERARQMQMNTDAANKAATDVIDASKAKWAMDGAQGQYRPNEETLFKAAEARGMHFAKAGMWDQYMQNDAQVAPLKMKTRAAALQRYENDGDVDAFVRTVYPTLFDGREIVGTEKIQGAPGSTNLGLAPVADKIRVKLSDGTVIDKSPDEMVNMVKLSLVDPVESAKRERDLTFARTKAQIDADAKIQEIKAKGSEDRTTEGVKGASAKELEGIKHKGVLEVTGLTNASRERAAAGNNAATIGAANIGADGRIAVAEAKAAAGLNAGGKKDQEYDQLHDEAIRVYGDEQLGALGGTKTGNESTQSIAAYAAALRKANPGLSVPEAIRQSSEQWKQSAAGKAWAAQQARKSRLKGPTGE